MTSYWYDAAPTSDRTDLVPEEADIVVVGAGITGLVSALLLSRAGKKVVVLEARRIGDVTTGHTTGKVSLLQGTKLSRMLGLQSETVARSYLEANREGQAWLLRFCADHAVAVQTRDAMTFAASPEEQSPAKDEHDAARRLGLATDWAERPDLGFETYGATVLRQQAQLDPAPLLTALVAEVTKHGGAIREHSRVVSVSKLGRPVVRTDDGLTIRCDDVVLATGTPILDRGLYFAKLEAHRSYVLMLSGVRTPGSMLLSAGTPAFSVRDVPGAETLLMVGGNGHVVGRTDSESRHLNELRAWAAERFPGGTETHTWSAQDYSSHDGIPFVGKLPRGRGRLHLATGYDKWGLTNGTAAALRMTGEILGEQPSWARPMGRRVTRPRGALRMLGTNAKVALALARGIAGAELGPIPETPPEGQGKIGRPGLYPTPIGISTVDGKTCSVVGLCTHLGGVLKWNDAERSWDCPLHGSRFAPDGAVLEGPATRPLQVRGSENRVPG
jgi:glycine/D-amino acid oxidase-like deaminating enzyme/nitrite reductase/ring-hydroxylating ferredoxin subunit